MYTKEDKRRWLILQCRYYNGEENPPKTACQGNSALLWDYEMRWVLWNLEDGAQMKNFEEEATCFNLEVAEGDKTPLTMKSLLFNRYMHWGGGYLPIEEEIKHFEETFYAEYLSRKTNRERRADMRKTKLLMDCKVYKGEQDNHYKLSKNEQIWNWEKEWVEALADSYSHRERFFKELMSSPCLSARPLSYWKNYAHKLGMPATLLACFGKNFANGFGGFKHEIEENFDYFLDAYKAE